MYEEFFRQRLAQLRLAKGVSARDMSLSLGQSESYINKIENGKAFPSMQVFFYICEYLGITPEDFFSQNSRYPEQLQNLIADLKELNGGSRGDCQRAETVKITVPGPAFSGQGFSAALPGGPGRLPAPARGRYRAAGSR